MRSNHSNAATWSFPNETHKHRLHSQLLRLAQLATTECCWRPKSNDESDCANAETAEFHDGANPEPFVQDRARDDKAKSLSFVEQPKHHFQRVDLAVLCCGGSSAGRAWLVVWRACGCRPGWRDDRYAGPVC